MRPSRQMITSSLLGILGALLVGLSLLIVGAFWLWVNIDYHTLMNTAPSLVIAGLGVGVVAGLGRLGGCWTMIVAGASGVGGLIVGYLIWSRFPFMYPLIGPPNGFFLATLVEGIGGSLLGTVVIMGWVMVRHRIGHRAQVPRHRSNDD